MKKVVIVVAVALIMLTGFLLLPISNTTNKTQVDATYLRVHIRANSNLEQDQKVKYEIKNLVVEFLTPKLINVSGLGEAKVVVENNLDELSNLSTAYLKEKGFSYEAKAKLNTEYFPTRSYENFTLEDGFYDALILELGEAKGNNWWCVVYPPLCFSEKTSEEKVEYKSLIQELIEKNKEE